MSWSCCRSTSCRCSSRHAALPGLASSRRFLSRRSHPGHRGRAGSSIVAPSGPAGGLSGKHWDTRALLRVSQPIRRSCSYRLRDCSSRSRPGGRSTFHRQRRLPPLRSPRRKPVPQHVRAIEVRMPDRISKDLEDGVGGCADPPRYGNGLVLIVGLDSPVPSAGRHRRRPHRFRRQPRDTIAQQSIAPRPAWSGVPGPGPGRQSSVLALARGKRYPLTRHDPA